MLALIHPFNNYIFMGSSKEAAFNLLGISGEDLNYFAKVKMKNVSKPALR